MYHVANKTDVKDMDAEDFDEDAFVERTCPECGEPNKLHMHLETEEDNYCHNCGAALPDSTPCENCGKYRVEKHDPSYVDKWCHRLEEMRAGKKLPAIWDHSCRCLDERLYTVTMSVYFTPSEDDVDWAVRKGIDLEECVDASFKEYCLDTMKVGDGIIDEKVFERQED